MLALLYKNSNNLFSNMNNSKLLLFSLFITIACSSLLYLSIVEIKSFSSMIILVLMFSHMYIETPEEKEFRNKRINKSVSITIKNTIKYILLFTAFIGFFLIIQMFGENISKVLFHTFIGAFWSFSLHKAWCKRIKT